MGLGLAEVAAGIMLAGLLLYSLLGGADFGGGLWDLLASGPRAADQRRLIERALAPVWEANHVWLVFVVVVLFTAFPPAYAVIGTALNVPLTVMLLGVVLRGSAFVFRQYGGAGDAAARRWGRVFAIASVITPVFLGISLGALSAGTIRVADGRVTTGFLAPWTGAFPLAVGGFALSVFAFLAAVYLTLETDDRALQDDFRRRGLAAGIATGAFALAAFVAAGPEARAFEARFLHSPWTWPLQLATGAAALGALGALLVRRYPLARALAIAQVSLIVGGWGLAQFPYLVAPDVTIRSAAAPRATLALVIPAILIGSIVLFPSLLLLFRVFKARRGRAGG